MRAVIMLLLAVLWGSPAKAVGEAKVAVVLPDHPAGGKPWVFYLGEPGPEESDLNRELLVHGYAVVTAALPGKYGSPQALKQYSLVYKQVREKHHLSAKPTVIGVGKGALDAFSWAESNAKKVSVVVADDGVVDFNAWPKAQKGDEWRAFIKEHGFKTEEKTLERVKNPINNLEPLVEQHVALITVYGDKSTLVKPDDSYELVKRYTRIGGEVYHFEQKDDAKPPFIASHAAAVVNFIVEHTKA